MATPEQRLVDLIRIFLPDIPVTIHDLKNPTSPFVCRVYMAILVELGVNTASLRQIQGSQLQIITYSDMFTDIVPCLNICEGIRYFMSRIGIDDFGLTDLLAPEHKRNLHLMNKLLQFISYSDEMIERLQIADLANLKLKRDQILARIEQLKTGINKHVAERAEYDNLLNLQENSVAELKKQLNNLDIEKEALQKKMKDAQELSFKNNETIKNYQSLEAKLKDNIVALEDMDEQVADNIVSKVEQMVSYREKLKTDIENAASQTAEKKNIILFISNQIEYLKARLNDVKGTCSLHKEICEAEKEIKSLTQKLDESINKKSEITERVEMKVVDVNDQSEKMQELIKHEKQKALEYEEKSSNLKCECEQIKAKLIQKNLDVDSYKIELYNIELEQKETERKHSQFRDYVSTAHNRIEKAMIYSEKSVEMVDKHHCTILNMKSSEYS